MKRTSPAHLPLMRKDALVIDELPDEVLVYDLDRHKAHCLNHTAALVWRRCDGRTSAPEIARQLSLHLDAPFPEELVWEALRQLAQFHLLEESVSLLTQFEQPSRRQMMRRLGLAAAIAVPVITSMVVPTAAEAATCIQSGSPCSPTILCCSPLGCNPSGKCR